LLIGLLALPASRDGELLQINDRSLHDLDTDRSLGKWMQTHFDAFGIYRPKRIYLAVHLTVSTLYAWKIITASDGYKCGRQLSGSEGAGPTLKYRF